MFWFVLIFFFVLVMEVLRNWVPWGSQPPPEDVEYIEVIEMVPKDSWLDFYAYLVGQEDADEDKPDSALSHTTSLSTTDSDQGTDPSFSKIMATLVSSSDGGNHESSEDEAHLSR